MPEQRKPSPPDDSLDRIERMMVIEEALTDRIKANPDLDPDQRERLIRENQAQIDRDELGDESDLDNDDSTALVRKSGPRSPQGQSGAAALPEEPSSQQ